MEIAQNVAAILFATLAATTRIGPQWSGFNRLWTGSIRSKRAARSINLSGWSRRLERIGNPHLRLQVVHIAGTKGKGSVAAMLDSCLRAAGYRTGFIPNRIWFT